MEYEIVCMGKINNKQQEISVIIRMYRNKENSLSRASRTSKASLPDFGGENLEEYMEILYTHQKQWEKEGKYMEADMAKKKLTQMRQELDKHKKADLLSKHDNERHEVEVAHVEEMAEFNKYWDEKMMEYQAEAEKLEDETLERHQAEMEEFEKEIEESIGFRQKESSEVINLKKIEESLARAENYIEAHRVQKQIGELERQQYEKWMHIRNTKIRNLLGQLKTKQENEVSALRQRIEQGFQEQKKARNNEYDKLVQKYMNFMKELESHQNQEIIRFDKAAKMQTASNFSKAASMSRALQSIQSRN